MTWSVGDVHHTVDSRANYSGSAFTIVDERNNPLVTFGYLGRTEADDARKLIIKALENAKYVAGPLDLL
jgi:hypothetical protein